MSISVIVLIILLILIIVFFRDFNAFIYSFVMIDIFLRIITYLKTYLLKDNAFGFFDFVPESISAILKSFDFSVSMLFSLYQSVQ